MSEELQFRLGAETWNQRQRAASCIAFGVVHLINVIYAVATLGILVLVAAVYMIIYLLALRRTGDRRSAVVAASKFHANCNLTALTLIVLTLLSTSSALDGWRHLRDFLEHERGLIDSDGLMQPPPMDVDGYLERVERCRHDSPDLHILTGVELGQPHIDARSAAAP